MTIIRSRIYINSATILLHLTTRVLVGSRKKKKMTTNIYLTKEQKAKLDRMCYNYQVSKSTIAECLLFYFTKYVLKETNSKEILETIGSKWVIVHKGTKTSIKPKIDPVNNQFYKNNTKAYTNVIVLYLEKNLDRYISKENLQKFNNNLNNRLQQIYEPNWDYNHMLRSFKRFETKRSKENG